MAASGSQLFPHELDMDEVSENLVLGGEAPNNFLLSESVNEEEDYFRDKGKENLVSTLVTPDRLLFQNSDSIESEMKVENGKNQNA